MRRVFFIAMLLLLTVAAAGCDVGLTPAQEKYNAGVDKYGKNDLDGALADFNEAIRLDPNLAQAYMNRGAIHAAKQDFDAAIEDSTKALDLKLDKADDRATAYTNRAVAYASQDNYDKALSDVEQALRESSSYAKAHYVKGIIHVNQGDRDKAVESLNRVIELEKDSETGKAAQQALDDLENAP